MYDFPSTRLGRSLFDILSFPVLLFRYFLEALQLPIPTYLGVAIGAELLIVTWTLILVVSSRLRSSGAGDVRVEYATRVGVSPQTSRSLKVGREKLVGLVLAVIFAVAVRTFPLIRSPLPIGPDVPAYIGWMSTRLPSPGFYPPFSNFLWPTLGVILGVSASLPASQLSLVELISISLNVIVTLAAYGAVVGLTRNNWVGLIAAVFAAASPSQYWHSAGLYRTMLGISLAFVTLSAYHRAMASHDLKNIVLLFFLTYTTCLAHPYPAILLLLGIIGYALVQNVARLKFWNIWQLKLTSSLILGVALPSLITAYIFFKESLTVMGNWLTEPIVAPIWSFENMLEYFGLLPLLLALLGILVACRRRKEHDILIVAWFFAAFIIAEQTLFHVYFWYDAPEVPRFLMLVYMPLIILASIGFQWLLSVFNWVKSHNLQLQLKTVFACFFIGTLLLSGWLYVANQPLHSISINEYHAIMFLDHYAPAESIVSAIGGFSIRPWIAHLTHLQPAYIREVTEDYLIRKAPGSMDIILSTSFNRVYDDRSFLIYQRNCQNSFDMISKGDEVMRGVQSIEEKS